MEPVRILGWIHRHNHALRIHLRRQRHLNQDAIYLGMLVVLVDQGEQLPGGHRFGRRGLKAANAEFGARFDLVTDIDLRSGIVPGEDYGESRGAMLFG